MTRSIRNFLATHNLLAVSARQQEVAMNTEQALDTTLLVDLNTVLNYQALKNPNREELTGKEEADRLHDFGGKVVGALSFSRAQPQHFAFLLGYGLGEVADEPGRGQRLPAYHPAPVRGGGCGPVQPVFYRGHALRAPGDETAVRLLFH